MAKTAASVNVRSLGACILVSLGDIFYQPWDYNDPPPEGFSEWTEDAIRAWWDARNEEAGKAALAFLRSEGYGANAGEGE